MLQQHRLLLISISCYTTFTIHHVLYIDWYILRCLALFTIFCASSSAASSLCMLSCLDVPMVRVYRLGHGGPRFSCACAAQRLTNSLARCCNIVVFSSLIIPRASSLFRVYQLERVSSSHASSLSLSCRLQFWVYLSACPCCRFCPLALYQPQLGHTRCLADAASTSRWYCMSVMVR